MEKKLSVQLAETIMTRYPNPDDFPYRSWSYSQGFMLMGFIHLYESTGERKYRNYVLKYADHHVAADGTMRRFTGDSMDDMMPGAVIAWAYRETDESRYKTACDHILSKFETFPRTSKGGFWHSVRRIGEMWVDGTFMGGMFLTHYGAMIGRTKECFAEVVRQLDVIHECCHKSGALLYHAWSENPSTSWANLITGQSSDVWSEGLGWYALILAETVRLMPEGMADKLRIRDRLIQLLNTLVTLQADNGLFYQVVDKVDDPRNWTDTSGSAMFFYAFGQAERLGIGDTTTYQMVISKGYAGIRSKSIRNEDGLIDVIDACNGLCVQKDFDSGPIFA